MVDKKTNSYLTVDFEYIPNLFAKTLIIGFFGTDFPGEKKINI